MKSLIVSLLAATALVTAAAAATPKNALGAVAVSPDGATVIAAGDNRVLYVVDPATLEVKQRVLIGVNPQEAMFSKDGSTLAVWDTDGRISFLSASDWSVKATFEDAEAIAFAPAGDVVIAMGRGGYGDNATTPVSIISLADGAKKSEASFAGSGKSIVAAPDGSSFAVLSERKESAAETKTDAPADLKDLAKAEFEQKNDGFVSEVIRLDASGKETGRAETWFTTYEQMSGVVLDGAAYFAGYSNENLKVGADGAAALFKMPTSYLYGFGVSLDGKTFGGGSLRDGGLYGVADGSEKTFKLDSLQGWPEYFEVFGFAPDGSAYGGTTAYRLVHIAPDGTVKTAKPVF